MRTPTTAAAGLLLLAGLLVGCGQDGGSAPSAASEEEFCEAYAGLFENMGSTDPDDTRAGIEAVQDWADRMREVGTPEDIPAEARDGFEVVLDSLQDIDPEASQQELDQLGEDLGEDAQRSGEAFLEYATTTCPDAMKGLLGDMEQELGDLEDELGDLEDLPDTPSS